MAYIKFHFGGYISGFGYIQINQIYSQKKI